MFDDLIPGGADPFADLTPGTRILRAAQPTGGFVASAKQSAGSLIKGAGQFGADFIPGVSKDNALKQYGQEVIDANPTAVHSLGDIADNPMTAAKEAVGNAGASMAGIVGARLLGQGIAAAAPLAGPAAPLVAGVGQGISLLGPYAVAALPSFGGIREQQGADDSLQAKAAAAAGAATVGIIENKFGPQDWALSALTKGGRDQLAEKFAAKTIAGSFAKGVGTGAAVEGGEELVQNPVEQLAEFENPTTRENIQDTLFSGAMGAIGGGIVGGPMAGLSHRRPADVAVVPRDDGLGDVQIDPTVGPLSAAAADHLHRGDAQVAEAATGDLFGDLAPAPIEQAIDPLFDLLPGTQADPLAEFAAEVEPVALAEAQSMLQQSRAAGYDGHAIAQHPAGGYMVVPREWLTAEQVQPVEQAIGTPEATTTAAPFADLLPAPGRSGLRSALSAATRTSRIPGMAGETVADPIAQDIIGTRSIAELDGVLAKLGITSLKPLGGGASSTVLDAGSRVVRLGIGETVARPAIEEMLQAEHVGSVGSVRYEVLQKADTAGITEGDVQTMSERLRTKGYEFSDPGKDNLGRVNGRLVVIDPGSISAIKPKSVDQAANVANITPSEAEKAAGNYAKGHIKVGALDIAIENPAGSTRTGPGWTTKMSDHYGYVKHTTGNDGDQVDVYVKTGTPADHAGPVFVVDQFDPATGKFDEHKAMIGYRFQGAAIKAYDAHFGDGTGPTRRKGVKKMSADEFKSWAQTGDTSKPAATNATIQNKRTTNDQIRYNQAGEDTQQPPLAEQERYRDVPENGAGAGVGSRPGQAPRASYGQARQGAVTVVGVHYSGAERQSLSSAFYGSGIKGAEAVRLQSLPENYRYRTYFYVNEGQGVFPESGVGAHAHEVELVNLYDAREDALDLAKSHRGDFNAFEMAIVKAGFDGYYVPEGFGRQGVAALLGPHTVPVTHKGVGYHGQDAQRPQQAPTETDADKIAAMRNLPMGKMTGADWKRMVDGVDLSHLDDAKTYYRDQIAYTEGRPGIMKNSPFLL